MQNIPETFLWTEKHGKIEVYTPLYKRSPTIFGHVDGLGILRIHGASI
jgi:hypothetical protein